MTDDLLAKIVKQAVATVKLSRNHKYALHQITYSYMITLLLPFRNDSLKSCTRKAASKLTRLRCAPRLSQMHATIYVKICTIRDFRAELCERVPRRGAGESRNCGGRARNERGIGDLRTQWRSHVAARVAGSFVRGSTHLHRGRPDARRDGRSERGVRFLVRVAHC